MSKHLLMWGGLITLAASTATAQQTKPVIPFDKQPSHANIEKSPKPTPATTVVATVAAVGCIERWTPQPGDAATTPPNGVDYILVDVAGVTASGNTAGEPKVQSTPLAARYLLLTDPKINLGAHLKHRVRIDGIVAPQPTAGASLADVINKPETRETNLPDGPEPKSYADNTIEISSLSMVAPSCAK